MKQFSIGEVFSSSFTLFKKEWKVLLGSFAVIFVINFLGMMVSSFLVSRDLGILSLVLNLLLYVVQLALSVGLIKIALGVVDGKEVKLDLMWESLRNPNLLVFYFVVSLLVGLLVGVGLLLLVIPGVFLAVKMQFSLYYLIDKAKKPIDSIKTSWGATNGVFLRLLAFDLILVVVNALAGMIFFLPLLLSVPVSMIALAMVYRKISS